MREFLWEKGAVSRMASRLLMFLAIESITQYNSNPLGAIPFTSKSEARTL
jgi:hypothetical protein